MILVSSCLAGMKTRYDGMSCPHENIVRLVKSGGAVAVCPEILGGLSIPREAAEIDTGSGWNVLEGKAKVYTLSGKDVTHMFTSGAGKVLGLARALGVCRAVLKSDSPSCGSGGKGQDGVTTALLKKNGIEVVTEEEFSKQ
ncbi:MAG: DUF523 domain-containing protein [Candidatus Glassbacteria bacterium]